MRNGNAVSEYVEPIKVGSYRTYEEWKLTKNVRYLHISIRSYRTYEEWKQICQL